MSEADTARQRLDKWLFFARIVKSRTLAATMVGGGKVRVNTDKVDKPAYAIRIGDFLTITLHQRILVYKVLALGVRRGPAAEAQALYEDVTPPVVAPQALPVVHHGGRPSKKARRDLDRLLNQAKN